MAPLADVPRLDQQLCFALYRASRAIVRAYGPLLEPLGLTYPQYLTMLVLWEEDGLSIRRLGERLALDSGTLTPLIKRLEQQELVERQRDVGDERVVHVRLTKGGRALQRRARGLPAALACQFVDLGAPAELAKIGQLRSELVALADKLER